VFTIAAVGGHDFLWAEWADACGVAEVAGVSRMLHSMNDARITVVTVRDRRFPFYIEALFWS
jgi:hypothetical protein